MVPDCTSWNMPEALGETMTRTTASRISRRGMIGATGAALALSASPRALAAGPAISPLMLKLSAYMSAAGTAKLPDSRLTQLVRAHFDLTPFGLREMLDLARPIYQKTASYGHFGRKEAEFTWERTDKASTLAAEFKATRAA